MCDETATASSPAPVALQTPVASTSSTMASVCGLTSTSPYTADSRLISSAAYPRLGGFYASTSAYGDQTTANYMTSFGSGTSSFYPSLSHPYADLKDPGNAGTWGSGVLAPQTACYPYDTSTLYPYGDRYSTMDSAARRKNATRETTNTLKAWLYEHRKNPYPTKGEKIMLAIITKMTLTQVSTWFANARRRLKKENKMTWEPRNKTSDGQDTDKESCNDGSDGEDNSSSGGIGDNTSLVSAGGPGSGGGLGLPRASPLVSTAIKTESDLLSCHDKLDVSSHMTSLSKGLHERGSFDGSAENSSTARLDSLSNGHHHNRHHHAQNILGPSQSGKNQLQLLSPHHIKQGQQDSSVVVGNTGRASPHPLGRNDPTDDVTSASQRPKIWSLAQTATSDGPPNPYRLPGDWANHPAGPLPDGLAADPMSYHHHSRHPGADPQQLHQSRVAGGWSDEAGGISLLSGPITNPYHPHHHHQSKMAHPTLSAAASRLYPCAGTAPFGHTVGVNENFSSVPVTAGFPAHSSSVINGSGPARPSNNGTADDSLSPTHLYGNNSSTTSSSSTADQQNSSALDSSHRATTNTFLGRVFSDFVSASGGGQGLDGLYESGGLGGGYGAVADDTGAGPGCVDLVKRSDSYGSSAFRPMKR